MNKVPPYIQKHAIEIVIAVATIAAVIVAYRGSPKLLYNHLVMEPSESDAEIARSLRELEDEVFTQVFLAKQQQPEISYSEALDLVLPISKTIALTTPGIVVSVKNAGTATANNVRILIRLNVAMVNYGVSSYENYRVFSGGEDNSSLGIEMDRITAGDVIRIAVYFQSPSNSQFTSLIAARNSTVMSLSDVFSNKELQSALETQAAQNPQSTQAAHMKRDVQNILTFSMEKINTVSVDVFVSSDEAQGSKNSNTASREDISAMLDVFQSGEDGK